MSNSKPMTREEEAVKYEEQKRKLKELMRRDGERKDWDVWRAQAPYPCHTRRAMAHCDR